MVLSLIAFEPVLTVWAESIIWMLDWLIDHSKLAIISRWSLVFLDACNQVSFTKFICSRDANEAYIGKTQRHLFARIKEHLNPLKQSAIRDHRLECDCVCTEKNFVVLKQCSNNFELSILESLLIKQHRPTLNQTMTNNGKSIFLQLF